MYGERRRRVLRTGVLVVAAALATGCTVAAPTPQPTPSPGPRLVERTGMPTGPLDRLSWAIAADVTTLDPLAAQDAVTRTVLANVCESLLRLQPDGTLAPGLAERRRKSATEWVYTLRPGASFSDGTPVTVDDVVHSLERRLDRTSPWSRALADVEKVEVTDERSVTVTLARANVVVDQLMATTAGAVVRRPSVVRPSRQGPVCSGPYTIAARVPGKSLTLVRTDGYWQPDRAGLAREVALRVIPDPAARAGAVVRGEVDGTYDPPAGAVASLSASPQVRVAYGRSATAVSVTVSNFDGPLRDQRLRRALSLAVDREALAAAAPGPGSAPAKAPSATGQWGGTVEEQRRWFVNLPPVERDVEAGRRLVAEAVEREEPVRDVVLAVGPEQADRAIARRIREAVGYAGLTVVVRPLPAAAYAALLAEPSSRGDIDAFLRMQTTDVADPLQVYARFTTRARGGKEARDIPGFDAGLYDEVYSRAAAEADRGPRLQLVDQLQKMVVAAYVDIPLYEQRSVVAERLRVTGAPAGFVRMATPWAALIGAAR